MAINKETLRHWGHALLRYGLAVVLLWFGFSQLKSPAGWTRLIPQAMPTVLSATSWVYVNGIFEVVIAILLMLGLFTRIVSALVGIHILTIAYVLGYGPVAVRDAGLAIAAFAVSLHGPDEYCLDNLLQSAKSGGF